MEHVSFRALLSPANIPTLDDALVAFDPVPIVPPEGVLVGFEVNGDAEGFELATGICTGGVGVIVVATGFCKTGPVALLETTTMQVGLPLPPADTRVTAIGNVPDTGAVVSAWTRMRVSVASTRRLIWINGIEVSPAAPTIATYEVSETVNSKA